MSIKAVNFSDLSTFLIANDDRKLFYEYIKATFNISDSVFEWHKKFVDQFIKNHNFRWKKKSRFQKKFFEKHYGPWLKNKFELPEVRMEEALKKDFELCSDRTKKRRAEELRRQKHHNEIELAFLRNLSDKDKIAAQIVKHVLEADDEMKQRVLQFIQDKPKDIVPYSPNESLALMTDGKLTRHQYELIQSQAKERNANIYSPYGKVALAKKMCYPDGIESTENGSRVPLQELLNKTAERLIESLDEELFDNLSAEASMTMISKWGMDGSSGQSSYKQVFDDDDGTASDASIFLTTLVPLQIKSGENIIWTNPSPSSTKLCRPIKFEYAKESEELTVATNYQMRKEIAALQCTKVYVSGRRHNLIHNLNLTMIDAKSTNYLTSTSSSNCNICGAHPSQMNNRKLLGTLPPAVENYQFGISNLHCWIRFLENMLHIAFKLPVKKWRVTDRDDKDEVEANKKRIQRIYKIDKGLYLDVVRQGVGNSNDGNTARRFFEDTKFAAETTGLDEVLVNRYRTILIAISSRKQIDPEKFQKYLSETADLYLSKYDWYYMPPSVHKVLFHGVEIMDYFDLPIGYFSEESQEARNKDFRRIRQFHTRKISRTDTNDDIMHGLLVSSDPLINSLRNLFERKPKKFDQEVIDLFVQNCE